MLTLEIKTLIRYNRMGIFLYILPCLPESCYIIPRCLSAHLEYYLPLVKLVYFLERLHISIIQNLGTSDQQNILIYYNYNECTISFTIPYSFVFSHFQNFCQFPPCTAVYLTVTSTCNLSGKRSVQLCTKVGSILGSRSAKVVSFLLPSVKNVFHLRSPSITTITYYRTDTNLFTKRGVVGGNPICLRWVNNKCSWSSLYQRSYSKIS